MKLQCSCGAKFAFEVTPEMAQRRVEFICPSCGADSSEVVNQLVRQELNVSGAPAAFAAPVTARVHTPAAEPDPAPAAPSVRVRVNRPLAPVATETAEAAPEEAPICRKHPGELATEKCFVCSKPICPQCMAVFGYLCSPLCKAKADSHGLAVPFYEGQNSVVAARAWKRTVRLAGAGTVVAVALLGVWIWYTWFGSVPKPAFSVRYPAPVFSGQSSFYGKDQIVFLRGGTLIRHDMKQNKELWSRYLVDTNQVERQVAKAMQAAKDMIYRANNNAWSYVPKMPNPEKLGREMERQAAAALELRVHGQNIWVVGPDKFTRFNPETGAADKEVFVKARYGGVIPRGNELLVTEVDENKQLVTRVNLDTAESRTEEILAPIPVSTVGSGGTVGPAGRSQELAGLPTGKPGEDANKPMDPAKVAAQAQNLSLPERLALPATLSNARNQERAERQLNERSKDPAPGDRPADEDLTLLPTSDGFAQFSVRMIESRKITRTAMQAPPKKSALDGPVSTANSAQVANEILNEMQRERGGDVIEEDQSRYQVKVKGPDPQDVFVGETIGAPTLFPLQTVKVLAAKNKIVVLDKKNKQLWQSTLNYPLEGGLESLEEGSSPWGQGPCVERKDTLYTFDEGVLTAFDLRTGNARWRYPSVGILGLFFDEAGMLYVNTSSGSPHRLRFSRQIDISARDVSVVVKIAPENGKVLWTAEPGGLVNYVSGKYLFTVQSYMPPEPDEDDLVAAEEGPKHPPYMRIKRINPRNGHIVWEHFQQRAPLDIQFDKNTIRLVFKKEVQVLKFLAF